MYFRPRSDHCLSQSSMVITAFTQLTLLSIASINASSDFSKGNTEETSFSTSILPVEMAWIAMG